MTVHSIVVGSLFLGATLGYSSNVHWYAEIIGTLDWSLAPFLKSLCLSVYQKRLERVQLSWPHSVAPLHPHLVPPFPLCLLPAVMKMQHGTSLKMIDTPGEGLRNRSNLSQGKSKKEKESHSSQCSLFWDSLWGPPEPPFQSSSSFSLSLSSQSQLQQRHIFTCGNNKLINCLTFKN